MPQSNFFTSDHLIKSAMGLDLPIQNNINPRPACI
jgi:hypothetical protein